MNTIPQWLLGERYTVTGTDDVSEEKPANEAPACVTAGNADHHKALWNDSPFSFWANPSPIKKKDLLCDLAGSIRNGR